MKIEIEFANRRRYLGAISFWGDVGTISFTSGSVFAELVQETQGLGSVSISQPYLIFDESAKELDPVFRKQEIVRLDRTKDGKVVLITKTEACGGEDWMFFSTVPAGDSK
jgi:hypothetical protein